MLTVADLFSHLVINLLKRLVPSNKVNFASLECQEGVKQTTTATATRARQQTKGLMNIEQLFYANDDGDGGDDAL